MLAFLLVFGLSIGANFTVARRLRAGRGLRGCAFPSPCTGIALTVLLVVFMLFASPSARAMDQDKRAHLAHRLSRVRRAHQQSVRQ